MSDFVDSRLRNDVWQQLLDSERMVRYYGELADRYRWRQMIPRGIMAASAIGGTAGFVAKAIPIPSLSGEWLLLPSVLLMVAAVVWDFMHNDGKKAAILYSVSVECGEYETELLDLWRSVESWTGEESEPVRTRLAEIERGMNRVTDRAGYADIRVDERLNAKTTREAYEVVAARFATGA